MTETNFDTLNMTTVTVDRFLRFVRESLEEEDMTPIIGIGKSGVGKTESIAGLCKEMGIGFCELRLVTMTEVDLLGIPTISKHGTTTWAQNDLLPTIEKDGERGILVLDEITSASSTIRAAAYQLLDSKRALGEYKLPPKWLVVSLGNGPSDGGVFSGMEHAFLNRCRCLRVEPDLKTFSVWAMKNGIHETVLAFLKLQPQYLHLMNPDDGPTVFPSPRSWTSLSRKLTDREKRKGSLLEQEDVSLYASACVGADVAPKFGVFYEYSSNIISPEDVLNGKAKTDVSNMNTESLYITVESSVKLLVQLVNTDSKMPKGINEMGASESIKKNIVNLCNWLIDVAEYKLDVAILAFSDLGSGLPFFSYVVSNYEFSKECPKFMEFATKYSNMLTPKKI